MEKQNFKNHVRIVKGFHRLAVPLNLVILIGSLVNLFRSSEENLYSASLICAISFLLMLLAWYIRTFPLKAQDRAIRAEENFRHFILTGKVLPAGLRLSQIIALRFASDEEFPALAERALREKMGNKSIKKAIQQWREDNDRV
ncbi:MAG: hypothetical protein EBZ67_02025 [Chitinophagia bacterium]|nr:hypothetical protein [Chitinophagia bacterium]